MTGIPTTFNTRFRQPVHPTGTLSRPIGMMYHRQGAFFIGWGLSAIEEPTGSEYAVLGSGFGWRRLMKNELAVYIIDEEGKRTLEREELGDLDKTLWPIGSDGEPLDPWARVAQLNLIRARDGTRLIFEAAADTAFTEVENLVSQICWLARDKDPGAHPVIITGTRQERNTKKNHTWWVPTFIIQRWNEPGNPAPAPRPKPGPVSPPTIEAPDPTPAPAAPRPRLSRGAHQSGEQPEALEQSLKDVLDDKIPW